MSNLKGRLQRWWALQDVRLIGISVAVALFLWAIVGGRIHFPLN